MNPFKSLPEIRFAYFPYYYGDTNFKIQFYFKSEQDWLPFKSNANEIRIAKNILNIPNGSVLKSLDKDIFLTLCSDLWDESHPPELEP